MLARMGAFDIASFKNECGWYKGKSTKKLLDGYQIFPGDPWAEENELIEKLLKDTWAELKKWGPMIDALAPEKQIRFVQALFVHLAMMGTGARCTPAEVKAMKGESTILEGVAQEGRAVHGVERYVKKNGATKPLVLALRDFRGSLVWHADERDSQEQKLAKDLLGKVDAILRPR